MRARNRRFVVALLGLGLSSPALAINPVIKAELQAIKTACAENAKTAGCGPKDDPPVACIRRYSHRHPDFTIAQECQAAIDKLNADQLLAENQQDENPVSELCATGGDATYDPKLYLPFIDKLKKAFAHHDGATLFKLLDAHSQQFGVRAHPEGKPASNSKSPTELQKHFDDAFPPEFVQDIVTVTPDKIRCESGHIAIANKVFVTADNKTKKVTITGMLVR